MKYVSLTSSHSFVSDQINKRELDVIMRLLETQLTRDIAGSYVEFGCYVGTTSLFIRRLLDVYRRDKDFHVYDSFEGLPEKSQKDISPAGTQFRAGELAASKKNFLMNFKRANLRPPVIHKAWFNELSDKDLPEQIAFAFLDGDYYESIITPLRLIAPRIVRGGVIVIDDYTNEALPGAAQAVNEWAREQDIPVRTEASLAILYPK